MSTPPLRRIAIIGAGAMGASLAAITSPHVPTILVVRNAARAERIRRHGIVVEGKLAAVGRPEVVSSIDDLADIHPIDLVFIATKTTSIPEVCAAMAPHLRDLPYLVSYQNGIEPAQTIMDTLGTTRVVRMVLTYGGTIVNADDASSEAANEPFRIEVGVHQPPHDVGGIGADARAFAEVLAQRLSSMGLPAEFADDIDAAVWRKGLLNAASNPIAALVQAPLGELMASPAEPLMERLLDEGMAVASAVGIDLGDGFRAQALETMRGGATHLPSMAEDVIHGRATEITQLNVQVAQHGAEMGVPTPTHDAVIALIETFDWRLGRTVPLRRGL